MKYAEFKNGDKMPLIGIGTFRSKRNEVFSSIVESVKAGYRHIDCAAIYGNEYAVGEALQYLFDNNIVLREELWITSKLWNTNHKQEDVQPAIEKTLEDLKLSYLDLYLIHWPVATVKNPHTPPLGADFIDLKKIPLTQTWEGLVNMKKKGLTRHIGVSNFSQKKIQDILDKSSTRIEVNQVELHPYLQQNELLEFCNNNNIHLTAYRPLGISYEPSSNIKGVIYDNTIVEIANKHQCQPSQVVLAWGIQRGTSVIPKSVNPERIRANFESVNIELDIEDLSKIEKLEKGIRSTTGEFCCPKGSPYTYSDIWDEQ